MINILIIRCKQIIKYYINSIYNKERKGTKMTYNIIDIIDKNLTNTKLEEIINHKLAQIINILEFNINE